MHEGALQAGKQRHHSKFDPVWQLDQVTKLQAPSGRHDWDPLQGMLKMAHSWADHRQASTCLPPVAQPVPGAFDCAARQKLMLHGSRAGACQRRLVLLCSLCELPEPGSEL